MLYKSFNQYRTSEGFILQKDHLQVGALVIPSSPLLPFFSCAPSLFLCFRQERQRTREWERDLNPPGDRIARKRRFRKRSSNLAHPSVPLVIPLSISRSFRDSVFLGFRWKPVESYQIDYSVPLLFPKCKLTDSVFQSATKFPIYGFSQKLIRV